DIRYPASHIRHPISPPLPALLLNTQSLHPTKRREIAIGIGIERPSALRPQPSALSPHRGNASVVKTTFLTCPPRRTPNATPSPTLF
ncbi:MAG: hypothetical protein RI897_3461, partial [Verrucomicrobiota bacterium]